MIKVIVSAFVPVSAQKSQADIPHDAKSDDELSETELPNDLDISGPQDNFSHIGKLELTEESIEISRKYFTHIYEQQNMLFVKLPTGVSIDQLKLFLEYTLNPIN